MKRVILTIIAALVFTGTANAQTLEKSTWPSRSPITFVVRGDTRPPVPDIPARSRPPVPEPPAPTTRPSVPKPPALNLTPSPTYNYQGCEIRLNVTGAANGTLITVKMLVMDFGAFSDDGTFSTPAYQEIAHATTINGVATVRVKSTSVVSYNFKAFAGSDFSNEYPVGWVANPDRLPCL